MSNEPSRQGPRQRLPWTIAAIAVVVMVASLVWNRGSRDGGEAEDASIAELSERLAALESGDGARSPRPRGPQQVGAAPTGAPMGMQGLAREQLTPEQQAAERERQLRELEAAFAADAADPATAPAVENTLVETISGDTMAGTGLKPRDVDIACKSSSCRIVGTFDRMGDAQDWSLFYITAAGGDVLSQTRMVFVPKPDGRTEVRIYSSRAKG